MDSILDSIDCKLLDDWQRNLPIESSPFAKMGRHLNCSESEIIQRLKKLKATGRISRVGATCTPNTVGASTLAAMAVPKKSINKIAELVSSKPGINHSYLRENPWNLWFVITGPNQNHVTSILDDIEEQTKLRVLDLPLVKAFNVDLGFKMYGKDKTGHSKQQVNMQKFVENDRSILEILTSGMPIKRNPYREIGEMLDREESDIIGRIRELESAGIISRLGVIVRHRALGWRSNAMVVWKIAKDNVEAAGQALSSYPGVTLCYERKPVAGTWPYRLYCMIHAKSRKKALDVLNQIKNLPEVSGATFEVLFSIRCFKQSGAMISAKGIET